MAEQLAKIDARIDKKFDEKFQSLYDLIKESEKNVREELGAFKKALDDISEVHKSEYKILDDKLESSNKDNDEKFANLVTEISEAPNRQGSENLLSTTQQQERGRGYYS